MRSALYRLRNRPTIEDDDGPRPMTDADLLNAGMVVVGHINGDEIVHAAPGTPAPVGAEIIQHGGVRWAWKDLRDEVPEVADRVLLARVRVEAERGKEEQVRTMRVKEAKDKSLLPAPPHALPLEDIDLPPHAWAGDE